MKTRKFGKFIITDELPKIGDTMVCIQRSNFNYEQTIINGISDPDMVDTKKWKVVLKPENNLQGLERYPEFKELVNKLANEVSEKINKEAKKIESEMTYKCQFVLEELIRELESRV